MKVLIVTDLDNTLVGDDKALQNLNNKLSTRRDSIGLVYATGRSYGSTRYLMEEAGLLEPDYFITGVGSEIYQEGNLDSDWKAYLSQDWDRQAICKVASEFSELALQPQPEQNPWKISFFLHPAATEKVINNLKLRLQQLRLNAQVVFSSGRDVDILPQNSNKGNATIYLQKRLAVSADKTLVCGDSGNDISLFEVNARGVIVGNARAELLNWHRDFGESRHFLAKAHCAGGILEAIAHFDLFAGI